MTTSAPFVLKNQSTVKTRSQRTTVFAIRLATGFRALFGRGDRLELLARHPVAALAPGVVGDRRR